MTYHRHYRQVHTTEREFILCLPLIIFTSCLSFCCSAASFSLKWMEFVAHRNQSLRGLRETENLGSFTLGLGWSVVWLAFPIICIIFSKSLGGFIFLSSLCTGLTAYGKNKHQKLQLITLSERNILAIVKLTSKNLKTRCLIFFFFTSKVSLSPLSLSPLFVKSKDIISFLRREEI